MSTRSTLFGWLVVVTTLLALPALGYAQEARLIGTVTDSTGGVLPGVTVSALHEATGNVFEAVTDETGIYRLAVRVGTYRITAQLSGFQSVNRTGVALLLGQLIDVNLQLAPATIQESVTVTGEAPLIETSSSTIGTNIDPRQMQELPINGRNWMDLTMLAPGNRRNESGGLPTARQGYAQINMDGQQVTTNYHSTTDSEQPKYSRDGIGEFEIITNRFDATHGRSAGVVVNAITKSGTNAFAGTLSGYFRDDKFNSKDFIQNRVLPYSNQQVSTTFGGPIRRDRMHFFLLYEYEREPKTFTFNSPYPTFNVDISFPRRVDTGVGRFDFQFTPQTRLSLRGQGYQEVFYATGNSATTHPANSGTRGRDTNQFYATFTQILGNRAVNLIKGGSTAYDRADQPAVQWQGGPFPYRPVLNGGSVTILLQGYTIGSQPLNLSQDTWSIRDDLTTSYNWRGQHDLKVGGEYMYYVNQMRWCNLCMGQMDARGGRPPANLEALFPVWNDASTWNLAPLSPLVTRVSQNISNTDFRWTPIRHMWSGWAQDDWKANDRLTLNLGLRYDLDIGAHSEKVLFKPWLPGNLPHDTNNFGPRLGFAYSLNDRTALRGGYGLFFTQVSNDGVQQTGLAQIAVLAELNNDRRPDFAASWFPGGGNYAFGPTLTYEQVLARACDQNFVDGCIRRSTLSEINHPWRRDSYSHQASIGIQRQIGQDMSIEANYVYTGGRLEEDDQFNNSYNTNLTYNPATGANYPFSDISRRPFPDWGVVSLELLEGRSNRHGGELTFTKRLSDRWQATANYTLSGFWDANYVRDQFYIGDDGFIARRPIGFALARDLGGEYTLAAGDQRHRAIVNGIWDLGYDVQLSGIYFFASGERRLTNTGQDLRQQGGVGAEQRLRGDGTIVPRNTLVGDPIHRVDLRLQKRVVLGRATLAGLVEVFNLFDHANHGSYVTNESNAQYGRPASNANIAYQPRMLQLGFRTTF